MLENMNLEELKIELAEVKLEIKNIEQPILNPNSMEDVDDIYQKFMEYGIWINEMNGRMDDINEALNALNDGS